MYAASIENRGDSKYHAVTKAGSFVLGTDGTAPNPVDALLASLGACVGHYVRDYLLEKGVACSSFGVETEGVSAADGSRLSDIRVWIDLKGTFLDEALRAGMLLAIERCKVYGTLRAGSAITVVVGGRPVAA